MIYICLAVFFFFYIVSFYMAFIEEMDYAIWFAILAGMNLSMMSMYSKDE